MELLIAVELQLWANVKAAMYHVRNCFVQDSYCVKKSEATVSHTSNCVLYSSNCVNRKQLYVVELWLSVNEKKNLWITPAHANCWSVIMLMYKLWRENEKEKVQHRTVIILHHFKYLSRVFIKTKLNGMCGRSADCCVILKFWENWT